MVKFIRNLILYWRFKFAFWLCEHRNKGRKNNRYIVVNFNGTPHVINRKTWRNRQLWHPALRKIKWQTIAQHQVTPNILK